MTRDFLSGSFGIQKVVSALKALITTSGIAKAGSYMTYAEGIAFLQLINCFLRVDPKLYSRDLGSKEKAFTSSVNKDIDPAGCSPLYPGCKLVGQIVASITVKALYGTFRTTFWNGEQPKLVTLLPHIEAVVIKARILHLDGSLYHYRPTSTGKWRYSGLDWLARFVNGAKRCKGHNPYFSKHNEVDRSEFFDYNEGLPILLTKWSLNNRAMALEILAAGIRWRSLGVFKARYHWKYTKAYRTLFACTNKVQLKALIETRGYTRQKVKELLTEKGMTVDFYGIDYNKKVDMHDIFIKHYHQKW